MNIVLLGGTRGMGRALARRLVERGDTVFLLGRNPEDLSRSAADLQARHPRGAAPAYAACDLARPDGFPAALDAAEAACGPIDVVIVTAARFATQDQLEADPALLQAVLNEDFTGTILFCEEARRRLLTRGGQLVVFSSVAGERGRKPVVLYGAAKAGLSAYLEGLDHRYHERGLSVVCVKPGFVRTGMTAGLKAPPFAGDPEQVAADVLRAMSRRQPVVYTPRPWALVMLIIRWLPRFLMRRLGF